MAFPLDQITHKKLVLAKQLYRRAVIDSRGAPGATDRIVAVIEFDLAMETGLKAIFGALDTSKTPPTGFPELIKDTKALLKTNGLGSLPDEAHVKYVRHIRNNAQHQAQYPNEADLSDCRTYTRDFLNTVVQQIWAISFENINLTDLIEDPDIKQLMIDAYKQYDEQKYSEAVDLASAAMDKTTGYVERAVVGEIPRSIKGIGITDRLDEIEAAIEREPGMVLRSRYSHTTAESELLVVFKRMREIAMYVALEMNLSQLVKYRQITGMTFFTHDEKHHRVGGENQVIEKADAEFALAYCTDAIIRIETHVGSIKKPFGRDWSWWA